MRSAVVADDRAGRDLIDAACDEFDVIARHGAKPAVVHQHALAEGRVVRQHIRQQILARTQLCLYVAGEMLAVPVVDLVDGAVRVRPLWIDLQGRVDAVVEDPGQALAIPFLVVGHVPQQEADILRHRFLEFLEGRGPLLGTLEYGQRFHLIGDGGHDLHGAGAVADDADLLAAQVQVFRPVRRMEAGAFEGIQARYRWQLRHVQQPHRADHDIGNEVLRLAVVSDGAHFPARSGFVVAGGFDAGVEKDVGTNAVLVRDAFEIALDLALQGEVARPVVLGERVRIDVVGRIDAGARIAVFVPGAAHLGVLLDQNVRDACALQAYGRTQASHARADDQYAVSLRHGERVALLQREVGIQAQPAGDHRPIGVGDIFADAGLEHGDQLFVRGGGKRRRLALPRADDGGVGRLADLVLHIFRQTARVIVLQAPDARALVALGQPMRVAGQVDQHHEQGGDVGAAQRALERGLPCVVAERGIGSLGIAMHRGVLL
ncbi:hypothetical protein D3C71_1000100 [compost metagenome]